MAIIKRPTVMLVIAALAAVLALALIATIGGSASPTPAQAATTQTTPPAEAPDGAESESATEAPEGAESESGTEAPDGYEDPAGENVDHQCPPDCGPGEKQ
jgi:hypothetical protein